MSAKPPLATVLSFGVFCVDIQAEELRKSGIKLKLQKQPFLVLKVLLEHAGEIVTREELRSEIWAADTFVDFDNSLNTAINKLRDVLGDTSNSPRFIETIPRRGYRFIAPVRENEPVSVAVPEAAKAGHSRWKVAALGLTLLVMAGIVWYLVPRHPPTEKAPMVLGEFVNLTQDRVFDGTLRQGLSVQLEQSPYLRFISEAQIRETLGMMGRAANSNLTADVAQEVCQRSNATVVVNGSIAMIGSRYDLVLKAVDCFNGESLASVETWAEDKNHVLDAISKLASDLRGQLGESVNSIQQFNIPLAKGTTPSLEALRCYTEGVQVLSTKFDYLGAIPWFEKATELDPKFALAYWSMGDAYAILGETRQAIAYTTKAFELRNPVSEREKALIEANYYYYVLGDITKARGSAELLTKLYPYSEDAHNTLAAFATTIGQHDVALAEYQEALRLAPKRSFLYRDVAYLYLVLDRVEDASNAVQRAHALGLDANLTAVRYGIAFYRDDAHEMARQVANAAGKLEGQDLLLALDADTAAFHGEMEKARTLSRRAIESAQKAGQKETSASYLAASALREALAGNPDQARQDATLAQKYSEGRDVLFGRALTSSYTGDLQKAEELADELAERFPEDTVVRCNYIPTVRGKISLMRSEPQQALDRLADALPCELGLPVTSYYNWPNMYAVYVRGEAYLAAHRGPEAVAEFEKVLKHRGIVMNEPIGALAYLQLGRARAIAGDPTRAKAAFQHFLDLWKDADGNLPVLREAKSEYARL